MKKAKTALLCALFLALFSAFVACTKPETLKQEDVTVSFAEKTLQLTVDETKDLTAAVGEKLEGEEYELSFSSSEPGVLSVTGAGKVTALKIGTATVTVTLTCAEFEAKDSCTVTVVGLLPIVDVETEYDAVYSEGLTLGDLLTMDEGYSWKEGADTLLNAGDGQSFTIVYTPSDSTRYEVVETPVIVNVEKASAGLSVDGTAAPEGVYSMFYTENATDIASLGIFQYAGDGTLSYSLKDSDGAEADLSQTIPEGKYTLTATAEETQNYKAGSASVSFEVVLKAADSFDRSMNGLPADPAQLSEPAKAEIMEVYASLSAEEKSFTVSAWNMTREEKYLEFFNDYVKSVDKGAEDGYFTYFHTAYGPSQVTLGYSTDPAEGTSASAAFDSEKGFADESASLKVTSSPDWTNSIYFKIGLDNLSWEDASGADAVLCYVYNGTSDLLMFGQWPTLKPLPAQEWTAVAYPVSMLNGTKGLPAANSFSSLALEVYYYNETADRDRLDNGVDLNITSFAAVTPAYVNGLIGKLDTDAPDEQLLRKINDAYYLLSQSNRAQVQGFDQVQELYLQLLGAENAAADVVVDFSTQLGMAQVGANIQAMAFSGYYPKLCVAPDKEEVQTVTCWENRVGSLTSYYKFDLKINKSLIGDFSGYNVLTFEVYFASPRNQNYSMKGDNKYYMSYAGKEYVYELNTWYTVRIALPEQTEGTTLTFYAWNATQDRAACFMMDKIYLSPIRAANFDFAADFAAQVAALSPDSTQEEIDAVRAAYNALSSDDREKESVVQAWTTLWETYYVAPALATLNEKIAATGDSADEILSVVNWYNALEEDLKAEQSISSAYNAFYQEKYAVLFAAEFGDMVSALTDESSDAALIEALKLYQGADSAVKENQTVAASYATLSALIEKRLNSNVLVDVSSDLARAYNLSYIVENATGNQTVLYADAEDFADGKAMRVTVSENWTVNSSYKMLPNYVNTTGQTVTVSFYVRSVDTQYRKIRVETTENGAWKGYGTDYYYLEKDEWTFVSFQLEAGRSFYVLAQWWKDVNGTAKYMIGYEMQLEFSDIFVVTADQVSALIAEYAGLTDETLKAQYEQKITDLYNILPEEEKANVVGYDDFIAGRQ